MNIVYFSTMREDVDGRFYEALHHKVPGVTAKCCRSFASLCRRLLQAPQSPSILVLAVSGKDELIALHQIDSLLDKGARILILPDDDSQTLTLAHRLRPKYISTNAGDFGDVADVIKKMADA